MLLQRNYDFPSVRNTFTTRQTENNTANRTASSREYHPPPIGMKPRGLGIIARRNNADRNISVELSNDYSTQRFRPKKLNENTFDSSNFNLRSDRTAISQGNVQQRNKILPSLGLHRYKELDLNVNKLNPFSVNDNTEETMIQQERDRNLEGFGKIHSKNKHVMEKTQIFKPSRNGLLRQVNLIDDGLAREVAKQKRAYEKNYYNNVDQERKNKPKVNILHDS